MGRPDRLFQIIQFLRTRRLTTAQWLAEQLEVSERTIYRDVQDLMLTGVPIEGEAGVGYILKKGYDLPPLMFDINELSSLVLGARMVASLGGQMQKNAERALSKLNSALPKKQQQQIDNIKLYAPSFCQMRYGAMIDQLNTAIREKKVTAIEYKKVQDLQPENRQVYPLAIFYWNDKWTMAAWCLLRQDFRHFRLDRIMKYQLLDEHFVLSKEQTLDTFFKKIEI